MPEERSWPDGSPKDRHWASNEQHFCHVRFLLLLIILSLSPFALTIISYSYFGGSLELISLDGWGTLEHGPDNLLLT
jgi:hypothetical protein